MIELEAKTKTPIPPLLVVRCLIIQDGKLLLVRRREDGSERSGLWEFPGGKMEEGEDTAFALRREVKEETALEVERLSPFPYVDDHMAEKGKYEGRLYLAHFYLGRIISGELQLSDEHIDDTWDGHEAALNRNLTLESEQALRCYLGWNMLTDHSPALTSAGAL